MEVLIVQAETNLGKADAFGKTTSLQSIINWTELVGSGINRISNDATAAIIVAEHLERGRICPAFVEATNPLQDSDAGMSVEILREAVKAITCWGPKKEFSAAFSFRLAAKAKSRSEAGASEPKDG